jgi:NAD(P)-dependent dehydrogenase (short-subunit alcohol dehydrogenase family)
MDPIRNFAEPLHNRAEGKTDPSKIKLKTPFVVAIAGGSEGIGLGCATALAKAGASAIVLNSRNVSKLEHAKTQILAINPKISVTLVPGDVSKKDDVQKFADVVEKEHGRLDSLILSAGVASALVERDGQPVFPVDFHEAPLDDTARVLNINVTSQWYIVHYFLPLLEATKDGPQTLVLLSSGAAHGQTS